MSKESADYEAPISELRQHAGKLCKWAKEGATIYITDHGERVAKLVAAEPVKPWITYNPRPKT